MRHSLLRPLGWTAALSLGLTGSLFVFGTPALAGDTPAAAPGASAASDDKVPTYNLIDAVNQGLVTVNAEGDGKGRMTLAVKNRSKNQLRVVLPPGLIASGASRRIGR